VESSTREKEKRIRPSLMCRERVKTLHLTMILYCFVLKGGEERGRKGGEKDADANISRGEGEGKKKKPPYLPILKGKRGGGGKKKEKRKPTRDVEKKKKKKHPRFNGPCWAMGKEGVLTP